MDFVGSSTGTNIALWWGMLTVETIHVWGQWVLGKSLYFPLKFCCEPKTDLKKNKERSMEQEVQVHQPGLAGI